MTNLFDMDAFIKGAIAADMYDVTRRVTRVSESGKLVTYRNVATGHVGILRLEVLERKAHLEGWRMTTDEGLSTPVADFIHELVVLCWKYGVMLSAGEHNNESLQIRKYNKAFIAAPLCFTNIEDKTKE